MSAAPGIWAQLRAELSAAPARPRFWLRDDDAVVPTPALERLLELVASHAVPLGLAVIPANTGEAVAVRLSGEEMVTVLVHGWAHSNHAPPTEKKRELGLHRSVELVLGELSHGLARLRDLHGERLAPVLVPPWNRIDRALLGELPAIGFSALSVFGPATPAPLPLVNSTVDIMDWHGERGCRPHEAIIGDILAQLRGGLGRAGAQPIGLLTHHLVHDEAAWDFLERLFDATAGFVDWTDVRTLVAAHSP